MRHKGCLCVENPRVRSVAVANLIVDPNEKRLIDPAFDKYMDAPCTRRELQAMINHFAKHLDEIYPTLDTQHIVINFLAEEKLNVTKDELLAYVEKKRQEMEALRAKQQKTQETVNESNGQVSDVFVS